MFNMSFDSYLRCFQTPPELCSLLPHSWLLLVSVALVSGRCAKARCERPLAACACVMLAAGPGDVPGKLSLLST